MKNSNPDIANEDKVTPPAPPATISRLDSVVAQEGSEQSSPTGEADEIEQGDAEPAAAASAKTGGGILAAIGGLFNYFSCASTRSADAVDPNQKPGELPQVAPATEDADDRKPSAEENTEGSPSILERIIISAVAIGAATGDSASAGVPAPIARSDGIVPPSTVDQTEGRSPNQTVIGEGAIPGGEDHSM